LVAAIDDLDELARAPAVHLPTLTADRGGERALALAATAEQRNEPKLVPELDGVADTAGKREDTPEPVRRRGEQRKAACSVAFELAVPPVLDPLEVGA